MFLHAAGTDPFAAIPHDLRSLDMRTLDGTFEVSVAAPACDQPSIAVQGRILTVRFAGDDRTLDRRIVLPPGVDARHWSAEHRDGCLVISMPWNG